MGKRVLAAVLIIIILMGVSGCMNKKKKWTPDEKKDQALAYLKEKYDEEFVAFYMNQSGWGQGHDVIYLYPKNGSKAEDYFAVWGTILDDGTYAMQDGYFGIIIRDEVEAVMSSFVQGIYKDFKLYLECYRTGIWPDSLTKGIKVREIQDKLGKDEYFSSHITVFVKQSSAEGIDTKESLRKIAQKMIENKVVGTIRLYTVFDNKYENVSMDILKEGGTDEYFVGDYTLISVSDNYEIMDF